MELLRFFDAALPGALAAYEVLWRDHYSRAAFTLATRRTRLRGNDRIVPAVLRIIIDDP